jgi:hypothetical protein
VFALTDGEALFGQVSEARLKAILQDEETTIHIIREDSNNYGAFLFITVSREREGRRVWVTFFGLGKHEQREQWIVDHWHWYSANPPLPATLHQSIAKDTVTRLIEERYEAIRSSISLTLLQTEQGYLP